MRSEILHSHPANERSSIRFPVFLLPLLSLLLTLSGTPLQAAPIPANSKVLFLGSGAATYQTCFQSLYAGDSSVTGLNITSAAYGSSTTDIVNDFYAGRSTQTSKNALLTELDKDYDYIVLVDSLDYAKNKPELHMESARIIQRYTRAMGSQVIIPMLWDSASAATTIGTFREHHYRIADALGLACVPVGLAWRDVLAGGVGASQCSPNSANSHAAYTFAATLFSHFFEKKAVSTFTNGLTSTRPTTIINLSHAAWDAARTATHYTGAYTGRTLCTPWAVPHPVGSRKWAGVGTSSEQDTCGKLSNIISRSGQSNRGVYINSYNYRDAAGYPCYFHSIINNPGKNITGLIQADNYDFMFGRSEYLSSDMSPYMGVYDAVDPNKDGKFIIVLRHISKDPDGTAQVAASWSQMLADAVRGHSRVSAIPSTLGIARLWQEKPSLTLVRTDNIHMSGEGYYLQAGMLYTLITGNNPVANSAAYTTNEGFVLLYGYKMVKELGHLQRFDVPPYAGNRTVNVPNESPVTIALSGVDVEDLPLTASVVTTPGRGTLGFPGGNSVTYTVNPAATGSGQDRFTYTVNNGLGSSVPATIFLNRPPTIASAVSANPQTVAANTTTLSVVGADDLGEAALKYTWSASGPAAVTFSATNDTNAAKTTKATFTKAGTYTFTVSIKDASGLTTTSSVVVTVAQTPTKVTVSPKTASVPASGTQAFTAAAMDQFGASMSTPVTWNVSGGGTISSSGVFTAGATAGGPHTVTATAGGYQGIALLSVGGAAPLLPPVLHYALDETSGTTAFDSLLPAQNGTLVNFPAAPWSAGKIGNALTFDGVDDMVDTPDDPFLDGMPQMTIAFWMKPSISDSDARGIISKRVNSDAANYAYAVFHSNGKLNVDINSSDNRFASNATIPVNSWTHVAIAFDGTQTSSQRVKLYINGVLDKTASEASSTVPATNSILRLGKLQNGGVYYAGQLDEVMILDHALSIDWVRQLSEVTPNAVPTVATPASASPTTVTGTSTVLSVLGADDGGESSLTYTWSTTGTPPAPVTFGGNGNNEAKTTGATFTKPGTYTFQVTIRDVMGRTTTSTVDVTVVQTATTVAVLPKTFSVPVASTRALTATVFDQFGITMTAPITWSASGGGTISSAGVITAQNSAGGPFTVTATSGSSQGTAVFNVGYAPPFLPPVLHYALDEEEGATAADSSSSAHDATLYNFSGEGYWGPGHFNNALTFDGVDDYVEAPDAPQLDGMKQMTIAFWLAPSINDGSIRPIMSKRVDFATENAFGIFLHTGGFINVDINSSDNRFASTYAIPEGDWTHVAIVFDGTQASSQRVRLYINGELDKIAAETGDMVAATASTLRLGNLQANTSFFAGQLDEVMILDYPLAPQQVAELAGASVNFAPIVVTAASPSAQPVTGASTILSVAADDNDGEANLTYTWATTGTPPAAVTFSDNGTNSAKSTTATFTKAGTYNFQVTIRDAENLTVTSTVAVTVVPTPTGNIVTINPSTASVFASSATTQYTQTFTAMVDDQFGVAVPTTASWNVSSGGAINGNGLFASGTTTGGPYTITATLNGGASATASVSVVSLPAVVHYALNETSGTTASDSALSAQNGTLINFPANPWNPGKLGNALSFDGIDDYVETPDDPVLDGMQKMTIAFWMNPSINDGSIRPVIGKRVDSANQYAYGAYLHTGSKLYVDINGTDNRFASNATIPVNTWTHVAIVFDGTQASSTRARLYLNGVLDRTAAESGSTVAATASTLRLGNLQGNATSYFAGQLDEVMILNQAVTAQEVAQLANPSTNAAPTVAIAASANPSPVTGTSTTLSVLGADDGGEAALTYTWATTGTPHAPVTFSANGTNAAKQTTATFTADGTYTFEVTIRDIMNLAATSQVTVTVSGTQTASPYETWAGESLPFDNDMNNDGVPNGIVFLLGAENPDDNASGILPRAIEDDGRIVLSFQMRTAATRGSATLALEHSSDLGITDPWVQVTVPDATPNPQAADVHFTIAPGTSPETVTVTATIQSAAAHNGKLFTRLKGLE